MRSQPPSKAARPEILNVIAGAMTLREIAKAAGLHLYDAMCAVQDAQFRGYLQKGMTPRGYAWEVIHDTE